MIQTRDQLRARHAYNRVERFLTNNPKQGDSYRTQVNGLGAAIMRNGLVAALAFLESRDDAGCALLSDLAAYDIHGLGRVDDGPKLAAKVRTLDVDGYLLATRDVLALAVWFRRAVQGLSANGTAEDGDDARGETDA
ncbi:type III-B CRISPR module-associated protein Cmr5 [Haliangium sp.]|uniref:type III-B CRISPR module-associated protein Cmr5 n=1 Tax=Haliangium sp. TaxID=2663208 RepID=UPI003D09DDDE